MFFLALARRASRLLPGRRQSRSEGRSPELLPFPLCFSQRRDLEPALELDNDVLAWRRNAPAEDRGGRARNGRQTRPSSSILAEEEMEEASHVLELPPGPHFLLPRRFWVIDGRLSRGVLTSACAATAHRTTESPTLSALTLSLVLGVAHMADRVVCRVRGRTCRLAALRKDASGVVGVAGFDAEGEEEVVMERERTSVRVQVEGRSTSP